MRQEALTPRGRGVEAGLVGSGLASQPLTADEFHQLLGEAAHYVGGGHQPVAFARHHVRPRPGCTLRQVLAWLAGVAA